METQTSITLFHYCSDYNKPEKEAYVHIDDVVNKFGYDKVNLVERSKRVDLLNEIASCPSQIIGLAAHGSLRGFHLRSSDVDEDAKGDIISFADLQINIPLEVKLVFFYSCNAGRVPLSDLCFLITYFPETIFIAFGTPVTPTIESKSCVLSFIEVSLNTINLDIDRRRKEIQNWRKSLPPNEYNDAIYIFNDREMESTQQKLSALLQGCTTEKQLLAEFIQFHLLTSKVPSADSLIQNMKLSSIASTHEIFQVKKIIERRMELRNLFAPRFLAQTPTNKYRPLRIHFGQRDFIDHLYVLCVSSCENTFEFLQTLLHLIMILLHSDDEYVLRIISSAIVFGMDPYNGDGRYLRFLPTKSLLKPSFFVGSFESASTSFRYRTAYKPVISSTNYNYNSHFEDVVPFVHSLPFPLVDIIVYHDTYAFVISPTFPLQLLEK